VAATFSLLGVTPVAKASSELQVDLEVRNPGGKRPLSNVITRVERDAGQVLVMRVYDRQSGEPRAVVDTSTLVELRHVDSGQTVRFAAMDLMAPGVYQVEMPLLEPGRWEVVTLPNAGTHPVPEDAGRSWIVVTDPQPAPPGSLPAVLLPTLGLAAVLFGLVALTASGRPRWSPAPQPALHDSWWNPP
jgi:hypothetical protein